MASRPPGREVPRRGRGGNDDGGGVFASLKTPELLRHLLRDSTAASSANWPPSPPTGPGLNSPGAASQSQSPAVGHSARPEDDAMEQGADRAAVDGLFGADADAEFASEFDGEFEFILSQASAFRIESSPSDDGCEFTELLALSCELEARGTPGGTGDETQVPARGSALAARHEYGGVTALTAANPGNATTTGDSKNHVENDQFAATNNILAPLVDDADVAGARELVGNHVGDNSNSRTENNVWNTARDDLDHRRVGNNARDNASVADDVWDETWSDPRVANGEGIVETDPLRDIILIGNGTLAENNEITPRGTRPPDTAFRAVNEHVGDNARREDTVAAGRAAKSREIDGERRENGGKSAKENGTSVGREESCESDKVLVPSGKFAFAVLLKGVG